MSRKNILDFKKLNLKNMYLLFIFLIIFLLIWFFPLEKFDDLEKTLGNKLFLAKRILEITEKNSTNIFFNVLKETFRKDSIIYFILIFGGTLNIVKKSGIFKQSFETLSEFLVSKETLFLIVFTTIFSIECIKLDTNIFLGILPIILVVSYLLGHSMATGISVTILGIMLKLICEYFVHLVPNKGNSLNQFENLEKFINLSVLFFLVVCSFFILYMKKFQRKFDLKTEIESINNFTLRKKNQCIKFSKKNILVVIIIAFLIYISIYGKFFLNWGLDKIGALFIWASILIGLACKMNLFRINILFVKGSKKLFNCTLIVIFFKIIISIFIEKKFFYNLEIYLKDVFNILPKKFYFLSLYILDFVVTIFSEPANSEKTISSPIMLSSKELVEMNSEAFSLNILGDFIFPLSLILIFSLFIANVSYKKWIQFFKKIFLIGTTLGSIVILFIFFTAYRGF